MSLTLLFGCGNKETLQEETDAVETTSPDRKVVLTESTVELEMPTEETAKTETIETETTEVATETAETEAKEPAAKAETKTETKTAATEQSADKPATQPASASGGKNSMGGDVSEAELQEILSGIELTKESDFGNTPPANGDPSKVDWSNVIVE